MSRRRNVVYAALVAVYLAAFALLLWSVVEVNGMVNTLRETRSRAAELERRVHDIEEAVR